MKILVRAWQLRQQCRKAMAAGAYWRAAELARLADMTHSVIQSRRLVRLTQTMLVHQM